MYESFIIEVPDNWLWGEVYNVKLDEMNDTERSRREEMRVEERQKQLYAFDGPVPEREITPELRQQGFDNYTTTDDHGMHIVGMVKDQNGTIYYKVKNSWNT